MASAPKSKHGDDIVILHADDDSDDHTIVHHAFKRARCEFKLHSVRDGDEAILWLAGLEPYADRTRYPLPHIVVADNKMLRVHGIEVVQWMRQQPHLKEIP